MRKRPDLDMLEKLGPKEARQMLDDLSLQTAAPIIALQRDLTVIKSVGEGFAAEIAIKMFRQIKEKLNNER